TGVAIRIAGDHAADPHAARRLGHCSEQGPSVEDVAEIAARSDRGEVVEVPAVVEAGLVGDPPGGAHLVDGGELRGELEPDAYVVHTRTLRTRSIAVPGCKGSFCPVGAGLRSGRGPGRCTRCTSTASASTSSASSRSCSSRPRTA